MKLLLAHGEPSRRAALGEHLRAAGHAVHMGLRRIFVTRGAELVGTVTGFDLVRVMTWDAL